MLRHGCSGGLSTRTDRPSGLASDYRRPHWSVATLLCKLVCLQISSDANLSVTLALAFELREAVMAVTVRSGDR